MTGFWTTDIRHFLDEQDRVPDDLPAVPRYMGAIVAAASPLPTGEVFPLDLHCRRRPGHKSCPGKVHAGIHFETGEISWFCPCCGDHGRICNWQGSPWDRRTAHSIPTACSTDPPAGFSPRATAVWNAMAPEVRAQLLSNFWCGLCRTTASVDLRSGTVSRGDLVLRGYCTRCGGEIARLVENVGRTQGIGMKYDTDKVDEVVLALLYLNSFTDHGTTRAWKGFDWDSLGRLHLRGLISDPKSRARSVAFSDEGALLAEELFAMHFGATG